MSDIKQFVANYISQNNRATAWPYGYVVQELKHDIVPVEYGDEYYYWDSENSCGGTAEKMLRCDYTQDQLDEMSPVGCVKERWEDVQWFFTEHEANQYLNRDGHNLGETRLYVKYWRRNSEAEMILRALFAMAGEDYDAHKK